MNKKIRTLFFNREIHEAMAMHGEIKVHLEIRLLIQEGLTYNAYIYASVLGFKDLRQKRKKDTTTS